MNRETGNISGVLNGMASHVAFEIFTECTENALGLAPGGDPDNL
jgi:hypothetical protein